MKNRKLRKELILVNAIAKLKNQKKPLTEAQQYQIEFFEYRLSLCLD